MLEKIKTKLSKLKEILNIKKNGTWQFKTIMIYIILIILIGSSASYAKYAYLDIKDYYLSTKGFYFNCDKLSSKGANIEMTNWSGVGQYEVTFNMNSLSNSKVKSTSDIYYNIKYSCSDNVVCSIKDSKEKSVIPSSSNQDSFTIVITIPPSTTLHDKDSVTLKVEASSTSPYRKKITGTFKLIVGYYGLSYEINDKKGSPYLETKITNTLDYYTVKEAFGEYKVNSQIDISTYLSLTDEEKNKCKSALITLTFDPKKVLLDMTDESYLSAINTTTKKIGNYEYVTSITFSIEALSSKQVKFYKKDTTINYTYPNTDNTSIIKVEYS